MRSLQKNYNDLHAFLSDLPCKPHIIPISETKIKDKALISISKTRFNFLHKNSVFNEAELVFVYPACYSTMK